MTDQLTLFFLNGGHFPASLSAKVTAAVSEVSYFVCSQIDNALEELGKENVKLTPELGEVVNKALDGAFEHINRLLPMLTLLEKGNQLEEALTKLQDLLTNVDRLFLGTMKTVSKSSLNSTQSLRYLNETLKPFLHSTISFALKHLEDVVSTLKASIIEATDEKRASVFRSLLKTVSSTVKSFQGLFQSQLDSLTDEISQVVFSLKIISEKINNFVARGF